MMLRWVRFNGYTNVFRRFLKVSILLVDLMFSGRMFHSAAEEISNKRLPC